MKNMKIKISALLIFSFLIMSFSVMAQDQDPLEIIKTVEKTNRESFNSSMMKIKISTFRYRVDKGVTRSTETPRISVIETILKKYGNNNGDSRTVSIVLEPIKDKGISMLTFEYQDVNKDNDVWLYLSALGKVKRLVSSEDGDGSFFGSEFSVEDMTIRKTEDYTYNFIQEDIYDGRPVWVIESIPTRTKASKSKYGKIVSWIDKERYIVLKENLYDKNLKLFKQQTRSSIEQVDKVWVARQTVMNNLNSRRMTDLRVISTAYNVEIPDEFLTQRTLTDFSFRERNLTRLRTDLK